MKTSELIGPALDWAVIVANGQDAAYWLEMYLSEGRRVFCARSSTEWVQGGPIIEREKIVLYIYTTSGVGGSYRGWSANKHERQYDEESGEYIKGSDFFMIGDTPLIAAMRCYVASKLGNEVDIPEELL